MNSNNSTQPRADKPSTRAKYVPTRHKHLRRHETTGIYCLWFKYQGKRYQPVLENTTDEKLALLRRDAEIVKIKARTASGIEAIDGKLTFDGLMERFLENFKGNIDSVTRDAITESSFISVESAAKKIRNEKPSWLFKPAGKLTADDFMPYLHAIGKTQSPSTYNRVMDVIKRSYKFGMEKYLVAFNAGEKLRRAATNPPKSDACLTDDQFIDLIDYLETNESATPLVMRGMVIDLAHFLRLFGFRINQARHVRKSDVELFDEAACKNNPVKGQIRVRKEFSKRGKKKPDQMFPIIEEAVPLIKKLLARPSTIFFGQAVRENYLLPIGKAYSTLNKAYRALDFPESIKGHHHFRHLAATRWIEAGINIKMVSGLLGHADIKVTLDTYGHVRNSALESELKKLEVKKPKAPELFTPEQIAAAVKFLEEQGKVVPIKAAA